MRGSGGRGGRVSGFEQPTRGAGNRVLLRGLQIPRKREAFQIRTFRVLCLESTREEGSQERSVQTPPEACVTVSSGVSPGHGAPPRRTSHRGGGAGPPKAQAVRQSGSQAVRLSGCQGVRQSGSQGVEYGIATGLGTFPETRTAPNTAGMPLAGLSLMQRHTIL